MTHSESERLFDLRERLDNLAHAVLEKADAKVRRFDSLAHHYKVREGELKEHGEEIKRLYPLLARSWSYDGRFRDKRRFESEMARMAEVGICALEKERETRSREEG